MITTLRSAALAAPALLLAGCGFANAGPPPVTGETQVVFHELAATDAPEPPVATHDAAVVDAGVRVDDSVLLDSAWGTERGGGHALSCGGR